MDESLLDYATQVSSELQEAIATSEDQSDDLILEHIKKLSDAGTSVLDPDEKAEWVTGFLKNESLASFCTGRVALLDFFTYCCINCQHVLPDLRDLEQLYRGEDGFVVVGVHSAKFEAERVAENVLQAAQRLGVSHPVLNDPKAELWNRLGIHCWPTLLLLDPEGKPILVLAGEGHREILFRCVSVALKHFREAGALQKKFVPPIPTVPSPRLKNNLRFPGKITYNPFVKDSATEPWMTISDSGNNRILLANSENNIIHVIGGLEAGLKDGHINEARFDNPQGVCWLNVNTFVVCDTGNHVLRRVSLANNQVEILAGTGVQTEFGDQGGLKYCQQSISSPWDIVLFRTPDMDMTIRLPVSKKGDDVGEDPEQEGGSSKTDDLRRVLLIASAGSHQIWALFLDTTVWWKYKTYAEGTLLAIVGSGREENRNNRYPNAAGLAQPSGLSLSKDFLFIADSESSTVRKLDLSSGQLYPLVGGDRNPCNLFAYGDIDGSGYSVRLQHPLAVACCPKTNKVYVADTYNHKIKLIDVSNSNCSTVYPSSVEDSTLAEPGGLCISPLASNLYVADTNNDRILCINMDSYQSNVVKLKFSHEPKIKKEKLETSANDPIVVNSELKLCSVKGSKLVLNVDCDTVKGEKDLHLTPNAPQRWSVKLFYPDSSETDLINEWDVVRGVRDGREVPGKFEACLKNGFIGKNVERIVRVEYFVSLCEGGLCFVKRFSVHLQLILKPDSKSTARYNIKCNINSAKKIKVSVEDDT